MDHKVYESPVGAGVLDVLPLMDLHHVPVQLLLVCAGPATDSADYWVLCDLQVEKVNVG